MLRIEQSTIATPRVHGFLFHPRNEGRILHLLTISLSLFSPHPINLHRPLRALDENVMFTLSWFVLHYNRRIEVVLLTLHCSSWTALPVLIQFTSSQIRSWCLMQDYCSLTPQGFTGRILEINSTGHVLGPLFLNQVEATTCWHYKVYMEYVIFLTWEKKMKWTSHHVPFSPGGANDGHERAGRPSNIIWFKNIWF